MEDEETKIKLERVLIDADKTSSRTIPIRNSGKWALSSSGIKTS
jgi:hypothetical protein